MLKSTESTTAMQALNLLRSSDLPIRPLIEQAVEDYTKNPNKRDFRFMRYLSILLRNRRSADVSRLRAVVTESMPKLKVATGLILQVDKAGTVVGISTYNGPLADGLEKELLQILSKRKFKPKEVEGTLCVPSNNAAGAVFETEGPTTRVDVRLRLGPLD